MYPFILKLVEIFKTKKKIFDELKNLVGEVKKIVKEPALAYSEEEQVVILKHRPFHQDTGLLPLVNSLMKANDELVHYQDDNDNISIKDKFGINMSKNLSQCGEEVHQAYRDMMRYIEKEQYFLERWFKPVLEEMNRKKNYREAWRESLSNFGNFLVILHTEIELFYNLLHLLKERGFLGETIEVRNKNRAIIKNNVTVFIQSNDFAHAKYWINYGRNREWFDKDEVDTLNNLVFFIEQQDIIQLEQIIQSESFKKIFNQEEIRIFEDILKGNKEASQVARDLAKKAEVLDILSTEARTAGADDVVEALGAGERRVEGALEEVQAAVPEVVKTTEISRRKKKILKRLKQSFRVRRKLSWRLVKRRSFSALNEADYLIKRAKAELRARRASNIQKKFAEERKKLGTLAKKLEPHMRTKEDVQAQTIAPIIAEEPWVKIGKPKNGDVFNESYKEIEFVAETNLKGTGYDYRWKRLNPDGTANSIGGIVTTGRIIRDVINRDFLIKYFPGTQDIIVEITGERRTSMKNVISNKITITFN